MNEQESMPIPYEYKCPECQSLTISYRGDVLGCPTCDYPHEKTDPGDIETLIPRRPFTKWELVKRWFGKFLP